MYERPDEHNATFRADDRLLHVGLDREGRRRIQREIAYMEQHSSLYLPELVAAAHDWLEVRIHAGTPPTGTGPWMRSLRQVLGAMHELEARPPWRPRRLEGLRGVCPHRRVRQAERIVQTVWRHNPVVTTHGNLRPGYILTRSGFHLGAVTGFTRIAGAPPERDLASALIELTPIVGVGGVLSMFPATYDRLALASELLHHLERLARGRSAATSLLDGLLEGILADPEGLGHAL